MCNVGSTMEGHNMWCVMQDVKKSLARADWRCLWSNVLAPIMASQRYWEPTQAGHEVNSSALLQPSSNRYFERQNPAQPSGLLDIDKNSPWICLVPFYNNRKHDLKCKPVAVITLCSNKFHQYIMPWIKKHSGAVCKKSGQQNAVHIIYPDMAFSRAALPGRSQHAIMPKAVMKMSSISHQISLQYLKKVLEKGKTIKNPMAS